MATIDPRTPVIVAVGQHTQRTNQGAEVLEPAALLGEAIRAALGDAAPCPLAMAVDSVRLVRSLSANDYRNAPLLVAQLAGIDPREHVVVNGGGETPGAALARACADIAASANDVVVIVGGEAWFSHTRAQRTGAHLVLTEPATDTPAPVEHGSMIEFVHPAERARGIVRPIQEYPLFENALRVELGHSVAEHQQHLGRFCARLSATAAANPYAWDRTPHTAEEIATPTNSNRLVGSPYTKLMVSNEQVDMAAALVVTSVERATALGIARERWVFPLAVATGEAPPISERFELHDSVLAREVGRALAALIGVACADAAHIDLYSCFPSAVQVQARELGLDTARSLSLTGGMRFGGGPWCGYSMHAFAAMVDTLRREPAALGLVSANGGAITKLALTMLSTTPREPFRYASAQPAIDASPRRRVADDFMGTATVETCTVMHARDGRAEYGIVVCRTPDDRRAWGIVRDPDAIEHMVTEDVVGRHAVIAADGRADID